MNYPFLSTLAIIGGLAAFCYFLGRLFAVVFHVPLLLRRTPEAVIGTLFAGTGLLTLIAGWGFHGGLAARHSLYLVLSLTVFLLLIAILQGRVRVFIQLPRMSWPLAVLAGCFVLRTTISLWTLCLGYTLIPFNDTCHYICVAEYLQTHDFRTPLSGDHGHPIWGIAISMHSIAHRMGPMFLLAVVQAALPPNSAFELFPAVEAWGLMLNLGAVFLLCRWSFRLLMWPSLFGIYLAAISADSLAYSVTNGFLCQVYGTAVLGFSLALLSRLSAKANWRAGHAWLFGLCVAFQLSVYNELSPILAVACLAYLMLNLRRAARSTCSSKFLPFAGQTLLAMIVFGNIEVLRAWQFLSHVNELNGVGWHFPWYTFKFFSSGMALKPCLYSHAQGFIGALMYFVSILLMILGFAQLARHRYQAIPMVAAFMFFGVLFLWFRLRTLDPWTGQLGHTWNMFKLTKWVYPLAFTIKIAGLAVVFRWLWQRDRLLSKRTSVIAATILLGGTSTYYFLQMQLRTSQSECRVQWKERAGVEHPFTDFRATRQRIAELDPRNIYLIESDCNVHLCMFFAYAFNDRPFMNAWANQVLSVNQKNQPDRFGDCDSGTMFLQIGVPPFNAPIERLPLHYSIVDASRPSIFEVNGPSINPWKRKPAPVPIADTPIHLETFSPHNCQALLTLHVQPTAPLPESERLIVRISQDGKMPYEITFPSGTSLSVSAPVHVPKRVGRITLELRCMNGSKVHLNLTDARLVEQTSAAP